VVLTDTINITNLSAGVSPNVVPGEASAVLDCRILPGTTPEAMLERVRGIVADPSIRIEVLHQMTSNESPTDDSLYRALAARAVEGRTDAASGPVLSPGFTDSIYLRPLGVHAYGFVPFEVSLADAETMHGHGERVSVANLRDGLRILYSAVMDVSAK
jgi:acetylornithine deacetylase/succinyl-diaminopimelate desuccinylase-like protein